MNKIEEKLRKHINDEDIIQELLKEFETDDSEYMTCSVAIYNYIWHNHHKPVDGKSQRLHIAGMVKSMWNKS